MLRKIIDYIEYTKTEDGWSSQKVHDEGESLMKHEIAEGEIEAIESGKRPDWTLLGLPAIRVNGDIFKNEGEM